MNRISPTGVEELKRRIVDRPVTPPSDLTVPELVSWLNGYALCQHDILDIIDKMFEDMRG